MHHLKDFLSADPRSVLVVHFGHHYSLGKLKHRYEERFRSDVQLALSSIDKSGSRIVWMTNFQLHYFGGDFDSSGLCAGKHLDGPLRLNSSLLLQFNGHDSVTHNETVGVIRSFLRDADPNLVDEHYISLVAQSLRRRSVVLESLRHFPRIEILDACAISFLRADAHTSSFIADLSRYKGRAVPRHDCVHFPLPGVTDITVRVLLELLH